MDLLELIKAHLRVTWNHQDEQILQISKEGQAYLESIAGKLDFDNNHLAIGLLKEYCRYAFSGAVGAFSENYRSRLLNLQLTQAQENHSLINRSRGGG